MSTDIKKWIFILTDEDANAVLDMMDDSDVSPLTAEELEEVKHRFEAHTDKINDLLYDTVQEVLSEREKP